MTPIYTVEPISKRCAAVWRAYNTPNVELIAEIFALDGDEYGESAMQNAQLFADALNARAEQLAEKLSPTKQ